METNFVLRVQVVEHKTMREKGGLRVNNIQGQEISKKMKKEN